MGIKGLHKQKQSFSIKQKFDGIWDVFYFSKIRVILFFSGKYDFSFLSIVSYMEVRPLVLFHIFDMWYMMYLNKAYLSCL